MPSYYLDCPFNEKEQAKYLGARWYRHERKWYVPPDLFPHIDQFNRWRPKNRIYLDCPYEEREDAKQAGAMWDKTVKRWFVAVTTQKLPTRFKRWLSVDPNATVAVPSPFASSVLSDPDLPSSSSPSSSSPSSSSPPPISTKKKGIRGDSSKAACLRINETMIVPQLVQECKLRDISGYTGKLGIGSVWQVNRQDQGLSRTAVGQNTSTKKKQRKDQETTKRPKKLAKTSAASSPGMPKRETPPMRTSCFNFSTIPRVTQSMTVDQLATEAKVRNPDMSGMSKKTKSWFLAVLGEDSIWMTNPDVMVDWSQAPRVSESLTKAQLVTEILTRSPSRTGVMDKTKDELLEIAGIGSIWTTGYARASPKTFWTGRTLSLERWRNRCGFISER